LLTARPGEIADAAAVVAFEKDIAEMEELLAASSGHGQLLGNGEEIRRIRRELVSLSAEVLQPSAWETVRLAPPRSATNADYVELIFDEFVELHGDRAIGDDRALRCGFARIGDFRVLLIGHQKGRTLKERNECYYGCAHPEGYRKALNKMRLAAKFGLPIVCLIDTPGAYPGIGAEERGQAQLIAVNLLEMSRLATAIVCVVIGEAARRRWANIDRVTSNTLITRSSAPGCANVLWKGPMIIQAAGRTAHG
jgi:acetyl-CoA carboxylase carboxyl transferase subunit alpha